MSELPKIVRARLQAQPAEVHPDADVLTAFYEQALPEKERGPVLAHLAECLECRDVVGMALPPQPDLALVHAVNGPATTWGWSGLMRWGSVAACAVVVGVAVMIYKPTPVVVRPRNEAEASAERDNVTAVVEEKAAAKAVPSAEPNLRADADQKRPAGDSSRVAVPQQPEKAEQPKKKAEAAPGTIQSSAVPEAPTQMLDRAAPPSAARGAFGAELRQHNAVSRAVPAPAPPAMKSESVEVAAQQTAVAQYAPTSDLKPADTPGRAKAGATGGANEVVAPEPSGGILAQSFSKEAQTSPAGIPTNLIKMPAQFELSPEGQLQRSLDSGKTWEAVPLVDRVKFNALAVMGPEVWVGGAAGVLYHSADNGRQWKLMKPSIAGVALTADIMNVRFTDMQHLAVITSDGQVWSTADGGQNWQRNR